MARLEREGKTDELERIRANAPNAIPQQQMRTVWRLLLTGRVKSPWGDSDLYRWKARLAREGFSTTLRLELREMLTPKVSLKQPVRWGEESTEASTSKRLKDLVNWEMVLAADHVRSDLGDLNNVAAWQPALPMLLDDFQQLLRDALDLLRELSASISGIYLFGGGCKKPQLGEGDDEHDRGYWELPSISSHWQNRALRDWVALIELLRDAGSVIQVRLMRERRCAKIGSLIIDRG